MPGINVAIAGLALLASLIALGAGWATLHDHERRITGLEQHGAARRATVDVTEDMIAMILNVLEDAEALRARLTNVVDRAEFIRNGGSPNAPWAEVYRMKNKK